MSEIMPSTCKVRDSSSQSHVILPISPQKIEADFQPENGMIKV
jgi:hypothetical protein